jgi:hypothetical protein
MSLVQDEGAIPQDRAQDNGPDKLGKTVQVLDMARFWLGATQHRLRQAEQELAVLPGGMGVVRAQRRALLKEITEHKAVINAFSNFIDQAQSQIDPEPTRRWRLEGNTWIAEDDGSG